MAKSTCFVFLALLVFVSFISAQGQSGDTLHSNEGIADGQTLVSSQGTFELGFFSPGNSKARYLGIWFRNMNVQTVVWVANGASPITSTNGTLNLTSNGDLSLRNGSGSVIWSTGASLARNPQAQLLDSGNFVLTDNGTSNSLLWQSFDHPCDTLLAGMRLGYDLEISHERHLTSWKSFSDPSPGNYTYGFDPRRLADILLREGNILMYRTGIWNGQNLDGIPGMKTTEQLVFNMITSQNSTYYFYQAVDNSVMWHLVVGYDGYIYRYHNQSSDWQEYWRLPQDRCGNYKYCGSNGICNNDDCSCLTGYTPKSPNNWNLRDFSDGCVRSTPFNCSVEKYFNKLSNIKLPDTLYRIPNNENNLADCSNACLNNCSCKAYAFIGENECVLWQELVDIVQFGVGGDDFYVRTTASPITETKNPRLVIIVAICGALFVALLILLAFFLCKRLHARRTPSETPLPIAPTESSPSIKKSMQNKTEKFELETLKSATDNFSDENFLGEGNFGPVFKGKLPKGKEIAVKRFAGYQIHGIDQLWNEITLLANVYHTNLVRLMGFCIQDQEMLLCYEYMPNGSLQKQLFANNSTTPLDWGKRYMIIEGISWGLAYLHVECGRKIIIHQDIKPENILLDENMVPKISDFGLAKLCQPEQSSATISKLSGTVGYMAPELEQGWLSTKSDVYSFGIVALEIVTGQRNNTYHCCIISHVLECWNKGRIKDVIDRRLGETNLEQVNTCIRIGLLCVQGDPESRPTMQEIHDVLTGKSLVALQIPPHDLSAYSYYYWESIAASTFEIIDPLE